MATLNKAMLLKRLQYHSSMVTDTYLKSVLDDAYQYIDRDEPVNAECYDDAQMIPHWVCGACKEPVAIGYKFCPMCGKKVRFL